MAKTTLLLLAVLLHASSFAQVANRYDIVISEIMADPTPVVGLPNAEFIELKNVSSTTFNLNGWRLSDATSTATISASFTLQPDSSVILCANSNVAAFSVFGRTVGVTSFPSLDNDGDWLTLRSPQNRVIHAVNYTAEWYANEAKKDGGWSLEMIDPKNPCGGRNNWKASTHNLGGTPGKTNAVNAINADGTPPRLVRSYAVDSITLNLVFDEPLDSATAATASNYSIQGYTIINAIAIAPLFSTAQLKLSAALKNSTVYSIVAKDVSDCKGNTIAAYNSTKAGLPQLPSPFDVVINEILFNPKPGGYDYVEMYNKSNKIIDISKLYLANRGTNNLPSSLKKLSEDVFYLFPGDYLVATEDGGSLRMQYLVKNEDAVVVLSSFPSFPDDDGNVLLISLGGEIIDEVPYSDDWHFGLIQDDEGVALERIDPSAKSDDKNNWHSAGAAAGYGTPGYKNSQYRLADGIKATVEISPKIFSPDNDGTDDIATVNYAVEKPGFVANVIVFNAAGSMVKQIAKNELLTLKGRWNWDGLGEKNNRLPIGTYIVFAELFDLQGNKKIFKHALVLARKLN